MLRLSTPLSSLAIATLVASACGKNGAPPDTVHERLNTTVPAVMDSLVSNLETLEESGTMATLERGLEALDGAWSGIDLGSPPDDEFPDDPGGIDAQGPTGDELVQQLVESVFNDDNYLGDGDYQIPAELLCGDDSGDAECIAEVERADLVVHAETAGDGLDLELHVGPAAPLTLELRSDRVTSAIDLGETARAAEHIAAVTGEDIELPAQFEGVFAATVRVTGEQAARIELAVREELRVEGEITGGETEGDRLSLSIAARDPLLAVGFDAASETFTADLDLPRTRLQAPWQLVFDDSFASGDLDIDWQGMSASVELSEGDETLTLANLGLGDATSAIKLDGTSLIAVDVNADAGRRFDLTVSQGAAGMPVFDLNPGLDASVAFNLAPLATAGDIVESHLLDETYRLAISGDSPRLAPIEAADDGSGGGLSVIRGQLSLSSTGAAAPIVVTAGQCLVGVDAPAPDAHAILGQLAAGSCE